MYPCLRIVAAPPAVVPQWREELEERFGLTFVAYYREYVRQKRAERGHGVNPWTTHTRFIISHALLRDPACTVGLQDWLGSYSPGSLLISTRRTTPRPPAALATPSNRGSQLDRSYYGDARSCGSPRRTPAPWQGDRSAPGRHDDRSGLHAPPACTGLMSRISVTSM